ncbi:MAG: hypothetical protein Q8L10_01765 [Candidatus Moranbacteria bacterium]|nr:hypothetical protein [Candidatus Moranbacteria bacterium]
MFKDQNQTEPQDAVNIQQQNFSQDKDLKIEDIPIHTMAQDIYAIEHPDEKREEDAVTERSAKAVVVQNLTEKQKTSPFLNPVTEIAPEKITSPLKTEAATEPAPQEDTPSASKNGTLAILASILILVIIGGGVYYFLSTQKKNIEPAAIALPAPTAPKPAAEQTQTPVPEPVLELSLTNPNYFPVDLANTDSAALKNTLGEYAQKIQDSAIATPVEFLIVDPDNNPISFETFAKKLGLTFSPALMANLGDSFSLFIYNDQAAMRLGLSVDSKNDARLKIGLSAEEKTLAQGLQPLIIPTDYQFKSVIFNTGDYNGVAIRYLNASDTPNLSVDYAISGKQLVIGTSKMTARMILDHIATAAAIPADPSTTEASTANAPDEIGASASIK